MSVGCTPSIIDTSVTIDEVKTPATTAAEEETPPPCPYCGVRTINVAAAARQALHDLRHLKVGWEERDRLREKSRSVINPGMVEQFVCQSEDCGLFQHTKVRKNFVRQHLQPGRRIY